MAALIGYLNYDHHARVIHRLSHHDISSRLATWTGAISTELSKDGTYSVFVNGKLVADGNVEMKNKLENQ